MKIARIGLVLLICLTLLAGVACTSQYTLTTSSTTGGSVTAPGQPGPFSYAAGTSVSITATPNTGYYFVNWTGATATIANPNSASTTITMNGNYSITANFAPLTRTLTTSSTAGGSVTAPGQPGPFSYAAGTAVTITATPNIGYYFVNWTGNTDTIANTNAASTTITMNGNYSITANFAPVMYTLTTSSVTGGSVAAPGQPGPFSYAAGTAVSITASPNTGYYFVNWTGDTATIANPNSASTTITMNGSYSITANFAMSPTTVYIKDIDPIPQGSQFTAEINISDVQYLAYASFDIQFNSNLMSYVSASAGNISGVAATVSSQIMQPGLLRILLDYSNYASSNNGNGVNGSGTLCSVTFNADAIGTGDIDFVSDQGTPQGKLILIKYVSYTQDIISNVSWLDNDIVITAP